MQPREVIVNDKMQSEYRYNLTEPAGRNLDPKFEPELTPKQMLALGVFGGKYMTDCRDEFPKSWFIKAKLAPDPRDGSLNCFGVNASKPLSYWEEKGWIHEDDPRGWFPWYCRYDAGRRHPDDERQIHRWKMMRRHFAQIDKNCIPGDLSCRPKQRQALLSTGPTTPAECRTLLLCVFVPLWLSSPHENFMLRIFPSASAHP